MRYGRFASPLRRLNPITRRPIPQVSLGLDLRGGSTKMAIISELVLSAGCRVPLRMCGFGYVTAGRRF